MNRLRRLWCLVVGHPFEMLVDDVGGVLTEPICARCGYQNEPSR